MDDVNIDSMQFDGMRRGTLYELVIFIHMLINNKNKEFDLGKQIMFGNKWDDLVVRVNNRYTFLQVKLVDNIEKKAIDSKVLLGKKQISLKKADFELQKYFASYLRIQDQLNSRMDGSKIKKLILFTNVSLNLSELNQKVRRTKNITKTVRDDIIPNTGNDSSSYKMLLVENDTFFKTVVNLRSDLDILAEELAKYAIGTGSKPKIMALDNDIFDYYHRALIDENVIEVSENLQAKFAKKFICNENLSCRAQNLIKKLMSISKRKKIGEQELKANMEKARWTVSNDFCSSKTKDKIFLPNYEITDKVKKDFFDLLELRVDQLGVEDLLKTIKQNEIQKAFLKYYDLDPKLIAFLINDYLLDRKLQDTVKERWFLHNERSIFIQKLLIRISKPIATLKTQKHLSSLKEIDQKYELSSYDDYVFSENCLNTKNILIVKTDSLVLTSLKIIKYLNKENREDFIFINLECVSEENEIIDFICTLKHDEFNLCIISYQLLMTKQLPKKLFPLLKAIKKQVIFITTTADDFLVNQFDECKKLEDIQLGLRYLLDNSKILKRGIIIQGQPLKLSDLMTNREDYKFINAEIINRLINNEIIEIHAELLGISDLEGAYSEFDSIEKVNIETFIHELSLESSNGIYIISGVPGSDLITNLVKYLFAKSKIPNLKIIKNNIKSRIKSFEPNTDVAVNHNVLVANDNFDETCFKQFCRNTLKKKVYWINLNIIGNDPKFILEQIYDPNFYIDGPRICSEVLIDKNIKYQLHSPSLSDVYIIFGRNKENMKEWLSIGKQFNKNKIKLLTSQNHAEDTYERLKYQNLIIHLLMFENNQLIWCKTHGTVKNLIEYRDRSAIFTNAEQNMKKDEFINKITNKQNIIIAADSGMGKSTTLINLCLKYYLEPNTKASPWIIMANLKDHLQVLKGITDQKGNREMLIFKILDFFSCVDGSLKDNFARLLLRMALLNERFPKPLIIAFDGFDEVLDEMDRNNILFLLDFFKNETKVKLFITTRLHYEQVLESALSTFAVRLFPMNDTTIRNFIKNYLKTRLHLMLSRDEYTEIFINSSDKMREYIVSFLKKIQDIFKRDVSLFIGTPLQLYLALESCATHFKQWVKDGKGRLLDFNHLNGNVCDVYERFINRKYNIFYKKFNIAEGLQTLHKMTFDECHRNIANFIILKSPSKNCIESSKHLVQSAGIARYRNSNIEFIHPTFAEYYVTETFMHWIEKWKKGDSFHLMNPNKQHYFIKTILLEKDYRVIRAYLNCKLSKECIKNVKLNESYYDAELLFVAVNEGTLGIMRFVLDNFSCVDLDVKNESGRSVLYEAINLDNLDMIRLIVLKGAKVNTKIYGGKTPLHYANACKHPNFDVVKFLVEEGGADVRAKDDYGKTVLHSSIYPGNLRILELLLNKGADIDSKTHDDETPLHLACRDNSNYDVIEFLIHKGANVLERDYFGHTALSNAVNFGRDNLKIIELLIKSGADVCTRHDHGETLLQNASKWSELNVVRCLLDNGADFRAEDNYGRTVLHSACMGGIRANSLIVQLLLQKVENVDAKDNIGRTALHYAIKYRQWDIVELLVGKDANVNVKTNHGRTVLHSVLETSSQYSDNLDMIKFLEEQRANIHARDNNGRTILHFANQCDKSDILEFLCNNLDVNTKDKNDETALHLASMRGDLYMVQYLLSKSANIDAKNDDGMTALHFATSRGDLDLVELLIEKGADTSAKNNLEETALDLALYDERYDEDIIEFLKDSANVRSGAIVLHSTSHGGDWNKVKHLVNNGADVNAKDHIGRTVLHLASMLGNLEIVEFLVDQLTDINVKTNHGRIALHYACKGGDLRIVKLLVDKGADVNAKTNHGRTALHSASQLNDTSIAEFLIRNGAESFVKDNNGRSVLYYGFWRDNGGIMDVLSPNCYHEDKDRNGETIFHLASYYTRDTYDTVSVLLNSGFDINESDDNGMTALHMASARGDLNVVECLINEGAGFFVNAINCDGETPLHLASIRGDLDIIQVLVDSGADVNIKNKDGKTILQAACSSGNLVLANFLMRIVYNDDDA